jgi:predicted nuclease of restriction endonuclease-like RecB superfamily
MLTRDHAIVEYRRGLAHPDRLLRRDAQYVDHARRMLELYAAGAGRTRRELHREVEGILAHEPECPSRRVQSFCKLLDDASTFDRDRNGRASKLRLEVFGRAASLHPLVEQPDALFERSAAAVKDQLARELGRPWEAIDAALYADVLDLQPLVTFEGYADPEALLSRYNVAQVQACLYAAEHVTVEASADFATILRYAKLARLLHEIRRVGADHYRLELSGPVSVLHETRRYGVAFARFLPALVSCRNWRLRARVQTPWRTHAQLTLSSGDGLRSHQPASDEFDSTLEAGFARKFGLERDGWKLVREGAIVHDGQATFVPDFVFRHEDGTEILFEIVGFWTPEYLEAKRATVRRARQHRLLLAVPERSLKRELAPDENVIAYKTAIKLDRVMTALEAMRRGR